MAVLKPTRTAQGHELQFATKDLADFELTRAWPLQAERGVSR
jgi:hypothetical protein